MRMRSISFDKYARCRSATASTRSTCSAVSFEQSTRRMVRSMFGAATGVFNQLMTDGRARTSDAPNMLVVPSPSGTAHTRPAKMAMAREEFWETIDAARSAAMFDRARLPAALRGELLERDDE